MAYVGLRIATFVAALAATGGIAAALITTAIESAETRASAALAADLDHRIEAGRTALAAVLEAEKTAAAQSTELLAARKSAAQARVRELLLLGAAVLDPAEVKLEAGESLELSATLPPGVAQSGAAQSGAAQSGAAQSGVAHAVGAAREDGRRLIASVRYEAISAANPAHARAVSALVNLGDAPAPFAPAKSALPISAGAAFVTALLAFFYARARIGRPIEQTLDRARALAHGDTTARADETRGGRDARELARAVNALVDRAERLKSQGREARDEDVSHLVRAIEAIAKGELGAKTPAVGEALQPLARALERTSHDLLERVRAIRELATELADRAAQVAPAAKKIGAASLEQAEALSTIGATAQEAAGEVKASRDRLVGALEAMQRAAVSEKKVSQELRAALLAAGRRLDVSRLPVSGDLAAVEEEMREAARGLEAIAASIPEPPPSVDVAITANLQSAAAGLVRIAETIARGLRVLERSSHASFEGADQLRRVVHESTELANRLGGVLAGFAVGTSFEAELIEKLERWREDAKLAVLSPDGLTDEGRALVRQITESSEAVRARLARLVSATESAVEVLRS